MTSSASDGARRSSTTSISTSVARSSGESEARGHRDGSGARGSGATLDASRPRDRLSRGLLGLGDVPVVEALFFGLKAAVLAIVLEAVVRIGRRALKNRVMLAIADPAMGV